MKNFVEKFRVIVDNLIVERKRKNQDYTWLVGIKEMLSSKLNIDQLIEDLDFFINNFNKNQSRILELGTGSGIVGFLLAKCGFNVVAYDVPNFLFEDRRHGKTYKERNSQQRDIFNILERMKTPGKLSLDFFNGAEIPEKEFTFDAVVLYAVVEHIDPPQKIDYLFSEIVRVLKPKGSLFIAMLPRRTSYTEFIARKFLSAGHPRLYKKRDFLSYLKKFNFNVTASDSYEMVPAFPSRYTNKFYFLLKFLNQILNFYPIKLLNHNLRFLAILNKKEIDPQIKEKLYFDPRWKNTSTGQGVG